MSRQQRKPLADGTRVRFNRLCVWPERVGCEGVVVTEPNGPGVYPDDKPHPSRVLVLLDEDPLGVDRARGFTCATSRDSLDVV